MVELDERKGAILCAVMEEYTRSAEPVGSEHPLVRDRRALRGRSTQPGAASP